MTIGKKAKYIIPAVVVIALYSVLWALPTNVYYIPNQESQKTVKNDSTEQQFLEIPVAPPDTGLKVPVPQPSTNPLDEDVKKSPFHLKNPPGIGTNIEYDPVSNTYKFKNMTGNTPYGPGAYMDINEYIDYDLRQEINNYWKNKGVSYAGDGNRTGNGLIPQLKIGSDVFESIFGGNTIDIRPSGDAELIFGIAHTNTKNYMLPIKQRKHTDFKFDQKIQLNLLAKIGDKIEYNLNYNTVTDFDFDNKMKLKYEGKEDDLIKLLEFGDVTLPLNSSLITGSQSLFGLKAQLQFGKLMVTAVASKQESEKKTITVSGGAQANEFYFKADEYEENQHFFLGQYFREHYNESLNNLPIIASNVVITKIEVWRTTIGAAISENRNLVAFTDLGEASPAFSGFQYAGGTFPDNSINTLTLLADSSKIRNISTVSNNMRVLGLTSGTDYEKIENARLLRQDEYTVNTKLGFISLNSSISADQVLAVAFQYQVIGDDRIYQVGEFSNEVIAPNCIRTKLIKSTSLNTSSPLWKLMMKNVYNLRSYQVSSEGFRLNILFTGDDEGIANGFFNTGNEKSIPLIKLMGLDKLNQQLDPYPDGIFDFIDQAATIGGTINAYNGRIYFPKIEPFGADLRATLTDPKAAERYAYDSLYTMTKTMAQQFTAKNKFFIEGTYKSSYGSEYFLGAANIPTGSVKVSAGGIPLTENVDFTVNYSMGTVSITNEGVLNSGTPITISLENRSTFGLIKRRMFGINLDYRFSKDFNVGATILNLGERPVTPKVNFGNEPINNTIWGMNFAYKTKVPFITKLVDLLPFHSTTMVSNFQLEGEFAHFIPGHARAIGKEGISYIDDFEASKSTVDLRSMGYWVLASTPQGQSDLFPEAAPVPNTAPARTQLAYGFNRSRLAWYIIDPVFHGNSNANPSNITVDDQSAPYARAVYESELFPNREQATSQAIPTSIGVLNLAFYPTERGPYNYDVTRTRFSAGLNNDGFLNDPETRWGGIMRRMDYTDFESANYSYIEFWMMDPFIENKGHSGGKIYFNLGDISEDILRDGVKFFENGLPADGSDENVAFTVWGRVPTIQMITNTFDANDIQHMDVGFDGLPTNRERTHFKETYLDLIANEFGIGSTVYNKSYSDPSADDYHFFRGSDYDRANMKINDRYKYYNNSEGNSTPGFQGEESYPTNIYASPNVEDVNGNNTLDEEERYYQYVIELSPDKMVVGTNHIVDMYEALPERLPNGTAPLTKWYQFRIPIKSPDKVVGNINGFNSIRFMRIFAKGFKEPVICRFATLELVKSDWRIYEKTLRDAGPILPGQDGENCSFDVATVSFEENANREPIPYVLPPGILREDMMGGMQSFQANEQSLTMKAVNLGDGTARSIYKSTAYDLRQYKRIKMFVHGEDAFNSGDLKKGDVTVFIRLGNDFDANYYQYEIPLEITPWGVGKDSTRIWPLANRMDIILDSLVSIKQERNRAVRNGEHDNNATPYSVTDDNGGTITVVGMPNLADVTTIMIAVRNPGKQTLNDGDDALPKSVEIWINELRLVGFNDKTGFAALARARLNLADIGDLTLSGSYSTPGFGALEQTVNERSQETLYTIDFATNIDGGKVLFPEKWNVKIPVHYDYSINMAIPEYNPLNPDVKFKEDIKELPKGERDSVRKMATVMTQRQNINLMNMRKERDFNKPIKIRPWDVENLDFSYSYSEIKMRDIDLEFDNKYRHEGQIGYTFNNNPKNYRPLSSVKAFKSKWLQLFRDVNFYLLPKNFTFRTGVTRELNEFKLRPKSQGNIIIDTSFVKTFEWRRDYSLIWDITQALKFDYKAQAVARIDEPQGLIDTKEKKDSVWSSFGDGGRTTYFDQRINASYQIPINKIPIFNWLTANARYSGTYTYIASPLSMAALGNTIQNSNTVQGTANVNFVTLYNNVPYLKRVNQGTPPKKKKKEEPVKTEVEDPEKTEEPTGKKKKKEEEDKVNVGKVILDGSVRFLMMVRNASLTYSEGKGSTLPGYMNEPDLFGVTFSKKGAPGFLYAFGAQPGRGTQEDYERFRGNAAQNLWLTQDSVFNAEFQTNQNQTINFRTTVEPFKDFRIDVMANRTKTSTYRDYFRVITDPDDPNRRTISTFSSHNSGTFTMTFLGLSTFFADGEEIFQNFRQIRGKLAQRIAQNNTSADYTGEIDPETGFPSGYGEIQQEVLVAAFLAAYGGKDPNKVDVSSPFPKIPLPNWRINYTGFTKIKGVNKVFQSLSLLHAYTSTYGVGNYGTNALYTSDAKGNSTARDVLNNFIPRYEMTQVRITEQFAPLVGFDMTLVNNIRLRVEYKKSRDVSMSFTNNQITEVASDEFDISSGYRIKNIKVGFVFSGMKREVVSDMNLILGFSYKNNITTLRKIVENTTQVSSGMRIFRINFSAEYQLSNMVGLRFYYEQALNRPHVKGANQYDNSNFETGIAVRLTLSQ